jgi:integrase
MISSHPHSKKGICMSGSISFEKDRGRWSVSWYMNGKRIKIRRYKGEYMYHEKIAQKCLSLIQGRYEQYTEGVCTFNIEEFTGNNWTDIATFHKEFMEEVVKTSCRPSTIKDYKGYWENWLGPFFIEHPIMLHEIQLDVITKLKNTIKNRAPKTVYNIVNYLHTFLVFAHRSGKIPVVPSFPLKKEYDLVEPKFKWVEEDEQFILINAIPEIHQPIFLFLKYHYRRPGEACALQWGDYDEINEVFTIQRTFSDRKLVESTKTRAVHYIPCDPDFAPIMQELKRQALDQSDVHLDDFIFQNHRGRMEGKPYTTNGLRKIWNKARKITGIDIELYKGTKHSSCTQFVNSKGGTIDELQILTDHARRDSVERYAKVGVERKRKMMELRRSDLKLVKKTGTK